MAYLLHIDTSGDQGLIALANNEEIVAESRNTAQRDHAAAINRMIETVCSQAGIGMAQLNAVVVCAGPGSYTGLRIGMATAKGLCYALDIPLILHNKLDLMIWESQYSSPAEETTVAMLRARDQEYFLAARDRGFTSLLPASHAAENTTLQLISSLPQPRHLIASNDIDNQFIHSLFASCNLSFSAPALAIWAQLSYRNYQSGHFADPALSEPFYLKGVYFNK